VRCWPEKTTGIGRYYSGSTMRFEPPELIPRGPATGTYGRSTSCAAAGSRRRGSMWNARTYRPACTCSISVAASAAASRYLAAECSCRVAAIDLTPNFVEAARILTARCDLAERIEFGQANALALPFQDGTFDHVGLTRSP